MDFPCGVLRYHQDWAAPPAKIIAQKCDNCLDRQHLGLIPACVEVCKTGALTFEESDVALKRKTHEVACAVASGLEPQPLTPPGVELLRVVKKQRRDLQYR